MQVTLRHRDEVRERAVVVQDSKDRAVRAVRRRPGLARRAGPTAAVDLADHASTLQRSRFGDADELVPEHAAEAHVAANELQVRFADAGSQHADENLAVSRIGGREVRALRQLAVTDDDRTHREQYDTRGVLVSGLPAGARSVARERRLAVHAASRRLGPRITLDRDGWCPGAWVYRVRDSNGAPEALLG